MLDVLRLAIEQLGVKVLCETEVKNVRKIQGGYEVLCGSERLQCRYLVIAGGGCAQPKLGSDGSTVPLLQQMGHKVHSFRPVLTALMTDTAPIAGLSGIRSKATVKLLNDEKLLYQEQGEVLFADYGVSGVCVMDCASYATGKHDEI